MIRRVVGVRLLPLAIPVFILIHDVRNQLTISSFLSGFQPTALWSSAHTKTSNVHTAHFISKDDEKERRMKLYRSRYSYKAPSAQTVSTNDTCGDAPLFEAYFRLDKSQRSAQNEDKVLYDRLFRKLEDGHKGTFVELGAYDGSHASNSRFYERCLGWRGLLIEGNPTNYPKVVENRPTAHRISYSPTCTAKEESQNKTVEFHDYPWANAGLAGRAITYDGKRIVAVPCGPLTPVLQDLLNGQVTLFSLDVEGAEPLVLEQIDFEAVFIEVMIVESWSNHCQRECASRDRAREIMGKAGYKMYQGVVTKSDLYIHPNSTYQLSKL